MKSSWNNQIDKPESEYSLGEIVKPSAESLSESFRSFGYDLKSALADIIDNSISAEATEIRIFFYWKGKNSYISIFDNGTGMDESELVQAMMIGCKNPKHEREKSDLGRFGLGLKTASFSQCRKLTVASKKCNSSLNIRSWDLEHIAFSNEWQLLKPKKNPDCSGFLDLQKNPSGTLIFLEKLDRVIGETDLGEEKEKKRFFSKIESVKKHLEMTFHCFLESGIKICINNTLLTPWDPFAGYGVHYPFELADESHFVQQSGETVEITAYVLPNPNKINQDDLEKIAGPKGWNNQQGFYVYRNNRIVVSGGWIGLGFKVEENFKLARIRVKISNISDHDWSIDIKKSVVRPPDYLVDELKKIAIKTRNEAHKTLKHRGKQLNNHELSEYIQFWNSVIHNGSVLYKINRNNILFTEIEQACKGETRQKFNSLMKMIEENLPILSIISNYESNTEKKHPSFSDSHEDEIRNHIRLIYNTYIKCGKKHDDALILLKSIDAFRDYGYIIDQFYLEKRE